MAGGVILHFLAQPFHRSEGLWFDLGLLLTYLSIAQLVVGSMYVAAKAFMREELRQRVR
jgi:hypothetical protein